MRNFDQQMKNYGDGLKNARYPHGEAELDREICRVVWNTAPEQAAAPHRRKRWLWPSVAAAACLVAVVIPLSLPARSADGLARVDVDGEQIYFACNNGCPAEGTVETFKTLIK